MKLPFGPSSRSVHTGLSLSAPTLRAPRSILQRRALRPSPPDPRPGAHPPEGHTGHTPCLAGGHEVKSPRQGQTFPSFFFWRKNRMG